MSTRVPSHGTEHEGKHERGYVGDSEEGFADRYCVIGAGVAGLVTARKLRALGVDCHVIEREDDVGGTWYFGTEASNLYRSVHLITSTRMTEFSDFPFPDSCPDFPSHRQAHEYLQAYARHHGIYEVTEFGRSVERVEPDGERGWLVHCDDGTVRRYRGVVIANGHNREPRMPEYPGGFAGEILHARGYREGAQLAGKTVLVVGGGNTGCDIAVDAARHARRALHSLRRGYHIWPKLVMGRPVDQVAETPLKLRLPMPLRRALGLMLLRMFVGDYRDYGLPKPDHKLFETHLTLNSQILYHLRHGDLTPKPDIEMFEGDKVVFTDDTREQVDMVLFATGYRLDIPFIDPALLNWQGPAPRLLLNMVHPELDTLYMAGMIQTDAGVWRVIERQAEVIARLAIAADRRPEALQWFRRRAADRRLTPYRYIDSDRHLLEVEHFRYNQILHRLTRGLDRRLGTGRGSR